MMRTVSSLSRLACSAALFALACTHPAYADPKITAANTIQFQDGQTSGPVSLLFEVDGLKKEQQSLVPVVVPVLTSQAVQELCPWERQTKQQSFRLKPSGLGAG
jgi:hypothetical protein